MSVLYESTRISDVVLAEEAEAFNYSRETITLVSGTPASVIGQIIGQISLGAASSAVKASGANTGNGTLVVDATAPVQANATAGLYTVRVVAASANAITFRVTDPKGVELGEGFYTGSGASATFSDRIKFAVTDGSTDFIVGDGFDVTVAAGSSKYSQLTPANLNGSQNVGGILIVAANAAAADAQAVAIVRGPVILKYNGIVWGAGMSTDPTTLAAQKVTAIAQLLALGITVRQDY